MTDRLAALLQRFGIAARAFHAGTLCGTHRVEHPALGQLHLIRRGRVEVRHGRSLAVRISEPSLVLYPRPLAHQFRTDPTHGAELVCADLAFEGGAAHPLAAALPAWTCLPLASLPGSEALLGLLFDEAAAHHCGRQAVLDRLFEVLLIQVLRRLMEQGSTHAGLLAGLAHPQLRRALVAMHERPGEPWSLQTLAQVAGMSRSVLANAFRDTVGITPGDYLQRWRLGLAQKALGEGQPLQRIAAEVGYGSEAALSRAFKALHGVSPRSWRTAQRARAA